MKNFKRKTDSIVLDLLYQGMISVVRIHNGKIKIYYPKYLPKWCGLSNRRIKTAMNTILLAMEQLYLAQQYAITTSDPT